MLSQALHDQILAGIAAGIPRRQLAKSLGVSIGTVILEGRKKRGVLQKAEEMEIEYRGHIVTNVHLKEAARILARNMRQKKHVPASNDALRLYQNNLGICSNKEGSIPQLPSLFNLPAGATVDVDVSINTSKDIDMKKLP